MSELGNLTGGILLSPWRMSTVKIRVRSLFRTPSSRIVAEGAGFEGQWPVVSGQSPVARKASSAGSLTNHRPRLTTDHWSLTTSFPHASTAVAAPSQVVHRTLVFEPCGKQAFGCKVRQTLFSKGLEG